MCLYADWFRVLANYLIWLLLMDLAPETTEALRQQQHEYRRILQVRPTCTGARRIQDIISHMNGLSPERTVIYHSNSIINDDM